MRYPEKERVEDVESISINNPTSSINPWVKSGGNYAEEDLNEKTECDNIQAWSSIFLKTSMTHKIIKIETSWSSK